MKKLLVVLFAAMMVLSVAAVSMAATVEGDFRFEWVQDASKPETEDLQFSKNDLRLNFKGNVSDTVSAYMQLAFGNGIGKDSAETVKIPVAFKEYYVTMNQSWGKVQAGSWDNKVVPSRVLLKPHDYNAVKSEMAWLFDVQASDAVTVGLWLVPDLRDNAMSYDIKGAYKADSFGAELHYTYFADTEAADMAFDFYYNVSDAFKAFVYGINAADENVAWADNLVPVIGGVYKAGAFTTSLEMALEEKSADYTPWGIQLKYGFTNKVNLEVEVNNQNADGDTKIVIRPRVKF